MLKTFQHPIYVFSEGFYGEPIQEARMLWTEARNKTESREIASGVVETLYFEPEALAMVTTLIDWDESTLIASPPFRKRYEGRGKLFTVADLELSEHDLVRSIHDEVTAIHEAAHAVCYWDREVEVVSLHIYDDADASGVAGECSIRANGVEVMLGKLLSGVVAGALAEHYYIGRVPEWSVDILKSPNDYQQALDCASKEYKRPREMRRFDIHTAQFIDPPNLPDQGEEVEVHKLIQRAMSETYSGFLKQWPLISSVATTLKERRTLSGSEFYDVVAMYCSKRRRAA
jgi:hypothetical protein